MNRVGLTRRGTEEDGVDLAGRLGLRQTGEREREELPGREAGDSLRRGKAPVFFSRPVQLPHFPAPGFSVP